MAKVAGQSRARGGHGCLDFHIPLFSRPAEAARKKIARPGRLCQLAAGRRPQWRIRTPDPPQWERMRADLRGPSDAWMRACTLARARMLITPLFARMGSCWQPWCVSMDKPGPNNGPSSAPTGAVTHLGCKRPSRMGQTGACPPGHTIIFHLNCMETLRPSAIAPWPRPNPKSPLRRTCRDPPVVYR